MATTTKKNHILLHLIEMLDTISADSFLQHLPSKKHDEFNPYNDNGGTVIGIAGSDFVVLGADTRHSNGYRIESRTVTKGCILTEKSVIVSAGQLVDRQALTKKLKDRITRYSLVNNNPTKVMSVDSIAQLLSNTLFSRRLFPFYTFNILGGLVPKTSDQPEAEYEGRIYGYDAIGSFQSLPYACTGSASSLIMPLLDNQIMENLNNGNGGVAKKLNLNESVQLVKDCFTAADERDIHTGDYLEIWVITGKNNVEYNRFELKKD